MDIEKVNEYVRSIKFRPGELIWHIPTAKEYEIDHIVISGYDLKIYTTNGINLNSEDVRKYI